MKNIQFFTIMLLLFIGSMLCAQAPVFQSCTGQMLNIQDESDNDDLFWNNVALWDPNTASHNLADAPVNLETFVYKGCVNTPGFTAQFMLSLDLDANGSLETVVHSDSTYPAGALWYNNVNAAVGLQIPFDNRLVNANQKYQFRLKATALNDSVVRLNVVWASNLGAVTTPLLPYGTHRIVWFFQNACGVSDTCSYNIVVKDSQGPTAVCMNGLSANLYVPQTASITIWASDFLLYAEDNYTPATQINLAVRRTGHPDGMGNISGFPSNADGTPQTSVTFNCDDISVPQSIELWVKDIAENTGYCETTILIADGQGWCGLVNDSLNLIPVRVTDAYCPTQNLENVSFNLQSFPTFNGYFLEPEVPISSPQTITPTASSLDFLDEVNTWDLLLISRHILNIELLNSPYKIIAADANRSGTVTTFDVVELRKLILGIYNELPNNESLIFVDKNQVFPNPLNPFTEPLQNSVTVVVDSINPLVEFVGIKIGNVDGCLGWNFTSSASDRSVISVPDHLMQTGQEVELSFPGGANNFYAWQMTLEMNGLEIVEIIPFNGLTSENFGVFDENDTTYLTFSAESPQKYFNLRLRALQSGLLSNMLHISNAITPSLSYDANGVPSPITLEFTSNTTEIPAFSANLTPNPWTTQANLQFTADQSGTGIFTISNALGQVVYNTKETYLAGPHTIALSRQQVPVAGAYWCRLAIGGQVQVVKMVINN